MVEIRRAFRPVSSVDDEGVDVECSAEKGIRGPQVKMGIHGSQRLHRFASDRL